MHLHFKNYTYNTFKRFLRKHKIILFSVFCFCSSDATKMKRFRMGNNIFFAIYLIFHLPSWRRGFMLERFPKHFTISCKNIKFKTIQTSSKSITSFNISNGEFTYIFSKWFFSFISSYTPKTIYLFYALVCFLGMLIISKRFDRCYIFGANDFLTISNSAFCASLLLYKRTQNISLRNPLLATNTPNF